jgi:benzoyl-CoA-dihydrodiol lyase
MHVQLEEGQGDHYELKLNSYDLGVDIELNDAIQRLRASLFDEAEQRRVRALDRIGG